MNKHCESTCLIAGEPTVCRTRACLIRQSALGSREAIELLFERVYSAVYKQAQRICRGGEGAPELAQETLVLAFEGLVHLKNPQLLLHQMNRIAWERHLGRLDAGDHAPLALDEFAENVHSGLMCRPDHPVNPQVLRETAEALAGAVRRLPPKSHETFRLRVLDRLSTRDTALRLGTSEMTTKKRLRRARELLRESLNRVLGPGR